MDYTQREKLLLELVTTITDGDLSNADLTCPICKTSKIIFSFTRIPYSQRFGVFIECKKCKYRQHYSLIAEPKNFKDELVLKPYQELEDKVSKTIRGDKKM